VTENIKVEGVSTSAFCNRRLLMLGQRPYYQCFATGDMLCTWQWNDLKVWTCDLL